MKKWRVKYQDIRALRTRRAFFNQEEIVQANSRAEAVERVKSDWDCFGHYGNYKARVIK